MPVVRTPDRQNVLFVCACVHVCVCMATCLRTYKQRDQYYLADCGLRDESVYRKRMPVCVCAMLQFT